MHKCQICLRKYKNLQYKTDRISICGTCVNHLNDASQSAENAYTKISEMLKKGIYGRILQDLESSDPLKRQKAARDRENFDSVHAAALPGWINRLLANQSNTKIIFKQARAHRRGLLRLDGPRQWSYPGNWNRRASRIRKLDKYTCQKCGAKNTTLDVHHIIYLSNWGTHQQSNLITLCRACHEQEHGRNFDWGEVNAQATRSPKRPIEPAPTPPLQLHPSPSRHTPAPFHLSSEATLQAPPALHLHPFKHRPLSPPANSAVQKTISPPDRLQTISLGASDPFRTSTPTAPSKPTLASPSPEKIKEIGTDKEFQKDKVKEQPSEIARFFITLITITPILTISAVIMENFSPFIKGIIIYTALFSIYTIYRQMAAKAKENKTGKNPQQP